MLVKITICSILVLAQTSLCANENKHSVYNIDTFGAYEIYDSPLPTGKSNLSEGELDGGINSYSIGNNATISIGDGFAGSAFIDITQDNQGSISSSSK